MLLKEDAFALFCCTVYHHVGKRLLILCTGAPILPLRTCALHGFDHIHLDLVYFSTKGLSSA
jgi:hypothetical protein